MTTENVDHRKPLPEIADELLKCLYGDKGYISNPLGLEFADTRVTLITGIKKYIPNQAFSVSLLYQLYGQFAGGAPRVFI
ncbi:transposase [Candidatus Enterovibrio escicola]|uniref:transposase n=1 Tax=Candidatus Enterovibrio escicola TaxID=1927127 RepID=UPI003C130383